MSEKELKSQGQIRRIIQKPKGNSGIPFPRTSPGPRRVTAPSLTKGREFTGKAV